MDSLLSSFIDACYTKSQYKDRNDWLEKNGFFKDYDTYDKEDLNYYYSHIFDVYWRSPKEGKRKIHD